MTIRADFASGGFSKNAQCVYLLTVRGTKNTWHYVGRTGTSNRTGVSSPYQRLAKHLAKVGNTQSCIWDSVCLSSQILEHAALSFVALPLADEDELRLAEAWLRWRFAGESSLNKERPPTSEPKISSRLRSQLRPICKE
jgi:hypothetical protein